MRRLRKAGVKNLFQFGTGVIFLAGSLAAVGLIAAGAWLFAGLSSAGLIFSVIVWSVAPLLIGVGFLRASWRPRPAATAETSSLARVLGGGVLAIFGIIMFFLVLLSSIGGVSLGEFIVGLTVLGVVPLVVGIGLLRR